MGGFFSIGKRAQRDCQEMLEFLSLTDLNIKLREDAESDGGSGAGTNEGTGSAADGGGSNEDRQGLGGGTG